MGKTKKHPKRATRQKSRKLRRIAAAIFALLILACGYWYFSYRAPKLPYPPLKDLAKQHGVDLGIHIDAFRLNDRFYPEVASAQFSTVVIDGGIHFKELRPTPTKYDFSISDQIVDYAEQNGMPVQLHHLIWGDKSRLPKWLTEGNYSKTQIRQIMKDTVTNIVTHYKGRVKEYTVVNEAFTEARHVYGLRDWFADNLGDSDKSYIDDVFKWAHQADPQAKLILNDFQNEVKNDISDDMYKYIKEAKARGVPIDGMGMQMHVNASSPPSKQAMIENMNRFSELGVKVYVTEFDVNTNYAKGSRDYKNQIEANLTYEVARACIEAETCESFVVFGVTQKNDLVKALTGGKSRDYMFDSRFRPKPSFYSFRQAWLER